jgi:dCTP deaminase
MELLNKTAIEARLSLNGDRALYIEPLLEASQIGEVSIDLRLGPDFLVSVLTRKAFVSGVKTDEDFRGIESYFRVTRREIGDRFIIYPGQIALACTLEYLGLPVDVYSDILSRSSYTRLGLHINTMVQPGFRGCFPLELFNHGNNPVEIVVGSRICQARLFATGNSTDYGAGGEPRKYFGNVRPVASRLADDSDLVRLEKIKERRN